MLWKAPNIDPAEVCFHSQVSVVLARCYWRAAPNCSELLRIAPASRSYRLPAHSHPHHTNHHSPTVPANTRGLETGPPLSMLARGASIPGGCQPISPTQPPALDPCNCPSSTLLFRYHQPGPRGRGLLPLTAHFKTHPQITLAH